MVGTTKGKGYQGVMKMHKMAGDSDTHGTHEFFRHGGSIGCRLTPGRVHKGKRMSGRMGGVRCTASDLVVVKVLDDKDVVLIKGAVPGGANGLVLVKGSMKDVRKYIVPQLVKEAESKNPMKASKKGAPSAGRRSSRVLSPTVKRRGEARRTFQRSARPPRSLLSQSPRRGVRGALGLQARRDRPARPVVASG